MGDLGGGEFACRYVGIGEAGLIPIIDYRHQIVVGFGLAGATAAITAHDNGASVLRLEKMPIPVKCDNEEGWCRCVYTYKIER